MPQKQDERPDGIGIPDPDSEPTPPKLGDAGRLGPVGERKLEENNQAEKDAIWRNRPKSPPSIPPPGFDE